MARVFEGSFTIAFELFDVSRSEARTNEKPRQQNLWVVFGSGRFPSW